MDFCIYDSRLTDFKEPFGAVPAGTAVRFCVHLPKELCPRLVEFVLCSDGEADRFFAMELDGCTLRYNSYRFTFTPPRPKLYFYYFQVTVENGVCHLIQANQQMLGELGLHSDRYWQLTVYDPQARRPAPLAAASSTRFSPTASATRGEKAGCPHRPHPALRLGQPAGLPAGQKRRDHKLRLFWRDLKGITQHLDYLQVLGVTCLYLNPIFEAHSNHRYNTANYLRVDPLLGTEEDFAELCARAKERGIAVILDGVFSHTGSDSVYFNRNGRYGEHTGAYRDPNSPYREWYSFRRYPDDYESWWGFITLPNVRENNPQYVDFICYPKTGVLAHWLRLGASGFGWMWPTSCPTPFWTGCIRRSNLSVRTRSSSVRSGRTPPTRSATATAAATCWQPDGRVMNYPFRNAVLGYLLTGDADDFLNGVLSIVENYPPPAMSSMMNSLSTHDTPRAITTLAGESMEGKDRTWQANHHYLPMDAYRHGQVLLKMASVLQYFLPGIPCLYYGDEAGLSGYADPFNRCCYPGDMRTRSWWSGSSSSASCGCRCRFGPTPPSRR